MRRRGYTSTIRISELIKPCMCIEAECGLASSWSSEAFKPNMRWLQCTSTTRILISLRLECVPRSEIVKHRLTKRSLQASIDYDSEYATRGGGMYLHHSYLKPYQALNVYQDRKRSSVDLANDFKPVSSGGGLGI
jgi:hypothetical protein